MSCGTVLGRAQPWGWAGPVIDYRSLRGDFLAFLETRRFNRRYVKCMLSYLDKYVMVIGGPMDVVRIFSRLTDGQQYNLSRGPRSLFNFLEYQGFDRGYRDVLRKNIPKDDGGFDANIPSEESVIASLQMMAEGCFKCSVVYELVLDSGLRLKEVCRFINAFIGVQGEKFEGFYVAPIGYFRRSKLAYFAFFTDETFRLLRQLKETVDPISAVNYRRKKSGIVAFKYLRKFRK